MNALAPTVGLPTTFDPAALDAQLAAAMKHQEESTASRATITKIKAAGQYRLRILPNGNGTTPQWWASYAIHVWPKGFVGNEKAIVFNSAKYTLGLENDPIQAATSKAFQDSKKLAGTNPQGSASLKAISDQIGSGPSFVVNAMLLPPLVPGQPITQVGPIIQLGVNKTFLDELFKVSRMVSPRFFMPGTNVALQVDVKPRPQGNGMLFTVSGREADCDINQFVGQNGFDPAGLKDLSAVVAETTSNALDPSLFSGDLFNPLKQQAQAGGIAMVAPAPAVAAIAAPVAAPAAPVYVAPVAAPVAPVYVAPVAAPVAAVAPIAMTAPGIVTQEPGYAPAAPIAMVAPVAVAPVAVAAPVQANAFAAPAAPVMAAAVAAPLALTEAAALEARLMSLVK